MEGVIILNTIVEEVHAGNIISLPGILGIVLFMVAIFTSIISTTECDAVFALVSAACFIFSLFLIIFSFSRLGPVVDYKYTYEVLIEDNVSFNDFNERYEIISQRGSIYTVIEREGTD